MRVLLRLAIVAAGYIVAVLAASLVAGYGILIADVIDGRQSTDKPLLMFGLVSAGFLAPYTAIFAFVPWLIAATIAEIAALRSMHYYGIAGLVAGLVGALILNGKAILSASEFPLSLVALLAGLVGGLAYWLIAGRWAGRWSSPLRPTEQSA